MAIGTVHSQLLFSRTVDVAGNQFGPVPDGEVWVVRDICAFITGSVLNQELHVRDHDTGITFVFFSNSAAQKESFHWDGRQVFSPGSQGVQVTVSSDPWDIRVSGYVLSAT